MSQSDLASQSGLTKRMISFYELKAVAIPLDRLSKIADALSTSLDELASHQPAMLKKTTNNRALLRRFELAKQLPDQKQKILIDIIDEMVGKKE